MSPSLHPIHTSVHKLLLHKFQPPILIKQKRNDKLPANQADYVYILYIQ